MFLYSLIAYFVYVMPELHFLLYSKQFNVLPQTICFITGSFVLVLAPSAINVVIIYAQIVIFFTFFILKKNKTKSLVASWFSLEQNICCIVVKLSSMHILNTC